MRNQFDALQMAAVVIGLIGLLAAVLGVAIAITQAQDTDRPPHHQPVTTTDTSTGQKD